MLTSPVPLVRDTEPSADIPVARALLVSVSLFAMAISIQWSLFQKVHKMQQALVLSSQTAAMVVKGVTDSDGETGLLGVPPGHTDAKATALWRGRPLAQRMAVFGLLACAQVALAVLLFRSSEVFPAIVLAMTAAPILVVAGGFFALRVQDLELTWNLLKQVRATDAMPKSNPIQL